MLILDGIFETDDERAKGSKIRNEIPKEFASVRTITGKQRKDNSKLKTSNYQKRRKQYDF